jgi:hypothetical protein
MQVGGNHRGMRGLLGHDRVCRHKQWSEGWYCWCGCKLGEADYVSIAVVEWRLHIHWLEQVHEGSDIMTGVQKT